MAKCDENPRMVNNLAKTVGQRGKWMTAFLLREDEARGVDEDDLDMPRISLDESNSSIISYTNSLADIALSFEGKGTGVGALAFDQVQVITFGPQVFGPGEMDKYGINFIAKEQGHFSTVEDRQQFSCRGWSRIQGDRDVWVEHDLRLGEEVIDLFIAFEGFGSSILTLSESFFVICDSVLVDHKTVRRGSLERYHGTARSMEWISGSEHIKLYLESKMTCQVIPLAGEEYFWGANFLISFEPEDFSKRMHLQFVKTLA